MLRDEALNAVVALPECVTFVSLPPPFHCSGVRAMPPPSHCSAGQVGRHARDYFDRQQPVEKRIIEYLLTIPDPQERRNQLDAAITPGPTRSVDEDGVMLRDAASVKCRKPYRMSRHNTRRATDTHDYMWSTPQRLYVVLDTTLKAYDQMRDAAASRLNTSEQSMLPTKVRVMKELRDELVRRYL